MAVGTLVLVAAAALLLLRTGGSDGDEAGTAAPISATPSPPTRAAQPPPSDRAEAQPSPIWRGDAARTWRALSSSIPARIGLAAAPLGPGATRSFGSLQTGHAWSTIKVPLLVTLLSEREPGALSPTESGLARAALTAPTTQPLPLCLT